MNSTDLAHALGVPMDTPGWLSVLVRHRSFNQLQAYWVSVNNKGVQHFEACTAPECEMYREDTPEQAICRALIAADPTLRAACEACEDWGNYKETHHD